VRLASQLSGWDIDIFTEAEDSERRNEEFRARSALFVEALDVDDVIAHLLVTEGFSKVEEVAFVQIEDLTDIEGFDEDVARELQARAQTFLETRDAEFEARRRELGVEDDLGEIEGITNEMMVALGEAGVKTRDDLGDLAGDELLEIAPQGTMTLDAANQIIMAARAHWFADEDAAAEGEAETPAEDGGDAPQAS
ncbi:MAG: helix-hairpin-helix domain-containing protein, partial [Rhodospirillales bacterium]